MVVTNQGKQPHGPLVFDCCCMAIDPVHNLGEAYTEHCLFGAISRKKPAINILISLLLNVVSSHEPEKNAVCESYLTRRVRIVAHQEYRVDLGQREWARQQSLAKRHADFLVDLTVHRGAVEILTIRDPVQTAYAV